MKQLIVAIGICFFAVTSCGDEQTAANRSIIKLGMDYTEATTTLSKFGYKGEKREYSEIIPENSVIRYFPLGPNVALKVVHEKDSSRVTGLALMTSPAYRPVKGLEVYLQVLDIQFHGDGTYTTRFAAPAPEKDGRGGKPE